MCQPALKNFKDVGFLSCFHKKFSVLSNLGSAALLRTTVAEEQTAKRAVRQSRADAAAQQAADSERSDSAIVRVRKATLGPWVPAVSWETMQLPVNT